MRVGQGAVVPHAMLPAIGDVSRDGVDPVEGIEEADAVDWKRGARDVARETREYFGIFRGDRLCGNDGKRDGPRREGSP